MNNRCEVEGDHEKCWRNSCDVAGRCMRDAACESAPEPTRPELAPPANYEPSAPVATPYTPVHGGPDLVERLRTWFVARKEIDMACGGLHENTPLLHDAADEIEALRAKVEELTQERDEWAERCRTGWGNTEVKNQLAAMTQERDGWKAMQDALYYQPLAAAQAALQQLRELLLVVPEEHLCLPIQEALALPHDTNALDRSNKLYAAGVLERLSPKVDIISCENLLQYAEQLRKEALWIAKVKATYIDPKYGLSQINEALAPPHDTAALNRANKLYAADVLEELLNQQTQGSYGNLMLKTKQRTEQLRKEAGE